MGKHTPSVLWPIHKLGHYPNVYLLTLDSQTIKLEYFSQFGTGLSIPFSRRDARMLARRLNQILDDTK